MVFKSKKYSPTSRYNIRLMTNILIPHVVIIIILNVRIHAEFLKYVVLNNVNVIYCIVIQTAVAEAYDTYPRERV